MGRKSQILVLVEQELHRSLRSKYILISFVLLPIIMWGFQGGFQMFMITTIDSQQNSHQFEDETYFVINQDIGNDTHHLGEQFVEKLQKMHTNSSNRLYGSIMEVIPDTRQFGYFEMVESVRKGQYSPLIIIPKNFTNCFTNFNASIYPEIFILANSMDQSFAWALFYTTFDIAQQSPFTEFQVVKQTEVNQQTMLFEGEEDVADSFVVGFIGFLVVILSVIAPVAYVSSSFAGEKEKHTLEGLLVLPMRKIDILVGKLTAGMILITLFAVMNSLGLLLYQTIVNYAVSEGSNPLTDGVEITPDRLMIIFLMVFLSAFISIGIGIAVASLAKDTSSAEGIYMIIMMGPAMVVGMTVLISGIPSTLSWHYLIPWTHTLAVLNKTMYPQTYTSQTLTGSLIIDIILHLGYLFLSVVGSLLLASKVFDRENLIS